MLAEIFFEVSKILKEKPMIKITESNINKKKIIEITLIIFQTKYICEI